MKKLSIICGISLMLALMVSSTFALSFKFDFYGGDTGLPQGDFEDPQEVTLYESNTVMVDIWLVDWNTSARGNIAAVDYYFQYSSSIAVNSVVCNNLKASGGQFDDEYHHKLNGEYALGVVEYGLGVAGPDVLLHTVELHCLAEGDDPIKATRGPDGIVLNVDGDEWTDVTDGDGTLHQEPSYPGSTTTTTTSRTTTSSSSTSSTSTTTAKISTTTTTAKNICVVKRIYGDDSDEVQKLKFIRDNVLNQTPAGQELIKLYYQWSPIIVEAMEEDEGFKEEMREVIEGILAMIRSEIE